MPSLLRRQVALAFVILAAAWPAAAAELDAYRGFVLGATTLDVMTRAGAADRDLKTVHERPALLQELSWRPPSVTGLDAADRDSVAAVVFGFIDDRLFRMTVDYDRSRTEGLTAEDVAASLTARYGSRSTGRTPATPGSWTDSIDSPTVVAMWREGDTTITLNSFPYSGRFGLTIASERLQALARKSQATAVIMDAREAPAREAAREKERAADAAAAAQKTRTTNKATFEP